MSAVCVCVSDVTKVQEIFTGKPNQVLQSHTTLRRFERDITSEMK